jgi:integrase
MIERNYNSERRKFVPSWGIYKQTLKLIAGDTRLTVIVRLGCELAMSPLEIACALKSNVDREYPRSLYIETAKKVRRKGKMVPRSRLLPINSSLYPILKAYVESHDSRYIIGKKKGYGPLTVVRVEQLFQENNIPWTPHKGRHFFKRMCKVRLIPKGMYDEGEMRKFMGHVPKESADKYDPPTFDLAMLYVEKVFGEGA